MKSNTLFIVMVVGIVACGIVVMVGIRQGWFDSEPVAVPKFNLPQDQPVAERKTDHKSLSDALGVSEDDMIEVGGIKRPKRDVLEDENDLVAARKRYQAQIPNPGNAPVIPVDANPQVAKLAEELATRGKSPAKSTYFGAEPFDREEYLKNPGAYNILTRPARVFQSAQPSEKVKRIQSETEFYQEILQGESVLITVKAEPDMPVTFHTQQLGEFDNRLKTITVAASKDGIAKVTYRAVAGVNGLVNVMAASPANSGQLKYLINVNLPE